MLKNDYFNTMTFIDLTTMAAKQSKLIGLSILALILFNFPLLSIFSRSSTIGGIPSIFIYLFLAWLGIIIFTRQNIDSKSLKDKKKDDE